MKKIVVLLVVAFALAVAAPVSADPGTLYVDDDGVCGGNSPCYTHPQDAVNAANPGDTILVYPGTYGSRVYTFKPPHWSPGDQYAPALIVYKDGLTIKAIDSDPNNTVIQSTHLFWSNPVAIQASTGGTWNGTKYVGAGVNPTFGTAPNGIAIIANNVTIEGFRIISAYGGDPAAPSHPNTAGVFVGALYAGEAARYGISGTVIRNNIISGHSGVRLWKAPNTTIEGNVVDNYSVPAAPNIPIQAAIEAWDGWCDGGWCEGPNVGSSGAQIRNNTVTTYYGGAGISFGGYYYGGQVDHSNLYIDGNTINSSGHGITFWGSGGTNKVITCNNTVSVPAGKAVVGNWWGTYVGPYPDCAGPITSNVTADPNPAAVNNPVTLTAIVDDSTTGGSKIASAEYSWDGSTWSPMNAADGSYDEVSEDVTANLSARATPGVYKLCVRGTDACGNVGDPTCIMFVAYDPTGGFVTGGGWIMSPAGAYTPDPTLEGRATFGFVSRYKRGATVPDGNTEFQFRTAGLNFHSTSYDWLVVNQAGARAQFKGWGSINGVDGYQFMLWATDGTPDLFRIQIWDDTGVIYDNGVEQAIGGGQIVVHKK